MRWRRAGGAWPHASFTMTWHVILSPQALEWSGSLLGLTGALLLATNSRLSRYGWLAFLIANFCMLGFAVGGRHWGLLTQQAAESEQYVRKVASVGKGGVSSEEPEELRAELARMSLAQERIEGSEPGSALAQGCGGRGGCTDGAPARAGLGHARACAT